MKYFVFIPSRYDSSRLRNKGLEYINETQTLIENVFSSALKSSLSNNTYVLTDHDKIKNKIEHLSKNILMTSTNLKSGTDRVHQGAQILNLSDDDFIINIQGDQAYFDYTLIDDMIYTYENNTYKVDMFTFASIEKDTKVLLNKNTVKLIMDKNDNGIYFSRSIIPSCDICDISKHTFYKHIGIYGYTYRFLKKFVKLQPSYLEDIESLEQLRAIENGYKIKIIKTSKKTFDINTKEDLVFIKNLNKK
jgi:3-deoxy-manno-octulosonate cytidylyltransferase (CMP-KDO synthetase)